MENVGTVSKTKPIPTRFDYLEEKFLKEAAEVTGMSVSEMVRRSVKLMRRQRELVQSYSFVLELV